jgi:hypothetical protein
MVSGPRTATDACAPDERAEPLRHVGFDHGRLVEQATRHGLRRWPAGSHGSSSATCVAGSPTASVAATWPRWNC